MGHQAQPFVYVICLSDTGKDGSVSPTVFHVRDSRCDILIGAGTAERVTRARP